MIFNFTKTKQFSARLSIKNKVIEEVKEIKLLGTYIANNLKWNRNPKLLVKKSLFKNGNTKTAEKLDTIKIRHDTNIQSLH